jgi:hypothetical protein
MPQALGACRGLPAVTAPKCLMCMDTGYWDYASFRIDPCACCDRSAPPVATADRGPVVKRCRHNSTSVHKTKKALRLMPLTSTRLRPKVRAVVTKKVAARFSSRYESSRPARPLSRSAFFYGRAHREAFEPAGFGNFHRSANLVLPDLQNSSWSKGFLLRKLFVDRSAVLSGPAPSFHQRTRLLPRSGGARA